MTEKQFTHKKWYNERQLFDGEKPFAIVDVYIQADAICDKLNNLSEVNEKLKIRNKGKQAFINKQDKIIKLLYNQCKDFKEILDDSNITYPIDERLNKFFEKGVKL